MKLLTEILDKSSCRLLGVFDGLQGVEGVLVLLLRLLFLLLLHLGLHLTEFELEVLVDLGSAKVLGEFGNHWQNVLVKSLIEDVQLRRRLALDVEPPVAGESHLTEDRAVGTEERGFATVQITVVPDLQNISLVQQFIEKKKKNDSRSAEKLVYLTAGLGVAEEALVALLLAVEVGLGYVGVGWVVDMRFASGSSILERRWRSALRRCFGAHRQTEPLIFQDLVAVLLHLVVSVGRLLCVVFLDCFSINIVISIFR